MLLAKNKKAYHDYTIKETFLAGVVLTGAEVKSIKSGQIDIKGSFATLQGNEVWLKNAYIAPYPPAKNQQQHYDPNQDRKLLLTKKEINTLIGSTAQKGVTLVPLSIHNKKNLIKIELGLGQGKHKHDKRETIKKKEFKRKRSQLLKNRVT